MTDKDKDLMSKGIGSSLSYFMATKWFKLFEQAPKITAALTTVAIALSLTVPTLGINPIKITYTKNSVYKDQVKSLDETRQNLNSLIVFIDDQKKQLSVTQQALESLKSEQLKLRPIIESDKKTIEAIFALQEERNKKAQSTERWIGFGLGLIASLFAAFFYQIGTLLYLKYTKKDEQITPAAQAHHSPQSHTD